MKKVVILGCGFVGARAARLFAQAGWEAIGVTRSAESAAQFQGEPFWALACDITHAASLRAAGDLHGADVVISAVSSGGGGEADYRNIYLHGLQNAIACLNPARVVFTSSTSVYGQTDGSWVTEQSPAEPMTATGGVLHATELVALKHGGIVARLAGIYGPGRWALLRKFFDNTAMIEGDGTRPINQIHAADAADALFHIVARELPPGIYNVADNTPQTQLECYEWLAAHFHRPLPPLGPVETSRKRGVSDKRVSNAKLRSMGWTPAYPSFQEALRLDAGLLAAVRADESGDARP